MKKGFTLVEIIISIGLILTIGVSATVVIINNKSNEEIIKLTRQILDASALYIETEIDENGNSYKEGLLSGGTGVVIPLNKLVETSYIKEETLTTLEQIGINENNYILAGVFEDSKELCEKGDRIIKFEPGWTDKLKNETETTYLCDYNDKTPGDPNGYDFSVNPFEENTLAYKILKSAMDANNNASTTRSKYLTDLKENNNTFYREIVFENEDYFYSGKIGNYPIIKYADNYSFDTNTGDFTYENIQEVDIYTFAHNNSAYIGKYLIPDSSHVTGVDPKLRLNKIKSVIWSQTGVNSYVSLNITVEQTLAKGYSKDANLSVAEDNYGYSYFFQNLPTDNYLTLDDHTWRIVRIQGDGSIKIILDDNKDTNTYYNKSTTYEDGADILNYIRRENYSPYEEFSFYKDGSGTESYSSTTKRYNNKNFTLKYGFPNYEVKSYNGTLTVDEIALTNVESGIITYIDEILNHCTNGTGSYTVCYIQTSSPYSLGYFDGYWSSPGGNYTIYYKGTYGNDNMFKEYVSGSSWNITSSPTTPYGVVLTIIPNILYDGGDGTKENPYEIKAN